MVSGTFLSVSVPVLKVPAFCLLALVCQTGFLHEVGTMTAQSFETRSPPSSLVQKFREDLLLVQLGSGRRLTRIGSPHRSHRVGTGKELLLRKRSAIAQ